MENSLEKLTVEPVEIEIEQNHNDCSKDTSNTTCDGISSDGM
jgi:hypothetical protein